MAPGAAAATLVIITGPTAAGKTDVALALAERLPVRLISADSAQVYRGMDIGTAKPDPGVLARYPHALVDILDPTETFSAADFVTAADAEVQAALAAGRMPVLVGGTMLYLKAFREGLAALPPADPAVRAAIARAADRDGWPALHERLRRVDPEAAAGIEPRNRQRLQRALEVFELTGRPISAWWRTHAGTPAARRHDCGLLAFAVNAPSRRQLHERIAARFDQMLAAGFLDEVRALRARGDLHGDLPALRSVGYRQAWSYLVQGDGDLADLREKGVAATRQLAKRQLTWMRRWPELADLPAAGPEVRADWIVERLRSVPAATR